MSTTDERRLTPTERLHEVTMAAMLRRPAEPEQTVELSRNARGVVQCTITARGADLDETLAAALAVFETVNDTYPYPVTNGGAE